MNATHLTAAAIGDIHLDASLNGRLPEAERVCMDIAADAAERKVDVIIAAGDFMQHLRSCAVERNTLVRVVTRLAEVAPVVVLRGNHDGLGELTFLQHLRTKHPVIVEEGYAVHVVAGIAVACAAWPCKAVLLASENTTSSRVADKALLHAFRAQMERLGAELDKHAGPKMLVAHAMVSGSATSIGQPLVGCELEVAVEDLRRSRAPIIVLAHVHKAQAWRGTGSSNDWKTHNFECEGIDGDVVYTGSPRPTDFGDLDDKSYLLTHFETVDGTWRPTGWERIPTTARPLHVAQATWNGERLDCGEDLTEHAGAEVQLRYSFPAKDAPRVAPQAAALRASLAAAGAAFVHMAPKKIATTEARAPQVALAHSLADKLQAHWDLRGAPPDPGRVLGRLEDLNLATAIPKPRPGWMRYSRLRFQGLRPFAGEVDICLDDLPGKLVCLTGENGAGKSTLLELPAAVFPGRGMRTHGLVAAAVNAPDAYLDVTFDCAAGEGLTVRQTFSKRNGKVEVLTADGQPLKDTEGNPVLPACGKDEYDAWARANLPHPATYFASRFLAQDRKDWLYLDDSPRKGVLLRVAGVEYLEGLATVASARAREATDRLTALGGKADELRRALALPELYGAPKKNAPPTEEPLYQTTEERRIAAEMAVRAQMADVAYAENTLTSAEGAARLRAERDARKAEADASREALLDLDARIADLWHTKGEADAIEKAERDHGVLAADLAGVEAAIKVLERERAALDILLAETITRGHALVKARNTEDERRADRVRAIDKDLKQIGDDSADLARSTSAHRHVLGQAYAIRAASAKKLTLDVDVKNAETDVARLAQAERDAAASAAAASEAARVASASAFGPALMADETARWPQIVRDHLEKAATLTMQIAAKEAERGAIVERIDALRRVHEVRADELRASINVLAWSEKAEDYIDVAQRAAERDDELLRAAEAAKLEGLDGKLLDVDAQVARLRDDLSATRLPAGVPDTVDAARAAHVAALAERHARDQGAADAAERADQALAAAALSTAERARAEEHLAALRAELGEVSALAAKEPVLAGAEEAVTANLKAIERLDARANELRSEASSILEPLARSKEEDEVADAKAALTVAHASTVARLDLASKRQAKLADQLAACATVLARREAAAAADALLTELGRQREALASEEERLHAALLAVPVPLDDVPSVESSRAALDAARAALATEEERRAVVEKNLALLAEREAERAAALIDVDDWTHLAAALGRNGMQADEVDAIGPRVAELATMFLHECFGTQWTVASIDTVGSCDAMIAVADELGDPRSDRTFSPGERAILAMACAMAIATIEAQNSGGAGTLLFDESGSSLSSANSLAWVRMIRRVVEIVGADKALYISHHEGAQAQADVRIVVGGGRAVVE